MTAVLVFFVGHWVSSLLLQSLYLHRYGSHGMFTMSRFWARMFYIATWLAQGSSFLHPRAYAIMHRCHHKFSDTHKDPHSPVNHGTVFSMMLSTYRVYENLRINDSSEDCDPDFRSNPPDWPLINRIAGNSLVRIAFMLGYAGFYVVFAPNLWWYLLIPVHALMGPVHGAIVNWCGHSYGYVRHKDTNDRSRNTLPIDLVTMGELLQNNHHHSPGRANFAHHAFEFDPTYFIIRALDILGIVHIPRPVSDRQTI